MKKIAYLLLILFSAIVIAGCGGGGGGGDDPTSSFAKLDITSDAKALVIATPDGGSRDILYEIDATGNMNEVKALDELGEPLGIAMTPAEVFAVDERYFIITFENSGNYRTYLVQRSDGSVFRLTHTPREPLPFKPICKGLEVQTDGDGNIYYISASSSRVIKLSIQAGNDITETEISRSSDGAISYFHVDSSGNVIYFAITDEKIRLINHEGSIIGTFVQKTEDQVRITPVSCFLGSDDYFYVVWYYGEVKAEIVKIIPTETAYDSILYTMIDDTYGEAINFASTSRSCQKLTAQGRLYFVDDSDISLTEAFNPTQTTGYKPRYIIDPLHDSINSYNMVYSDNTKLYFFGNNGLYSVIFSIDPVNPTDKTIFLNTSDYTDINQGALLDDGSIIIGGIDSSDEPFFSRVGADRIDMDVKQIVAI